MPLDRSRKYHCFCGRLAVGGDGMAVGVASVFKRLHPNAKLIVVESVDQVGFQTWLSVTNFFDRDPIMSRAGSSKNSKATRRKSLSIKRLSLSASKPIRKRLRSR